ncbi:hypothetical protein [Halorussus salinus]|uniref:hypothetical protein n=1 Tax=Halorussus salinus TaxID=1364935 RepID=UPI001091CA34|nr:hypothetical protein [Halorussus salinus]
MSNRLSDVTEAARTESTDDSVRDPLVRVVEVLLEATEESDGTSSDGRPAVRPFLLVDLSAVLDYLGGARGNGVGGSETRGRATEAVGSLVGATLRATTDREARERGDRDGERLTTGDRTERAGESDGRGTLSKLFLLGIALGVGYAVRRQSGSVGETVGRATDRVREVADRTAVRSGEAAQRTEAAAGEAADRIEEGSETAADRVQEGGEAAAEQVRERGETAADRVQESGQEVSDDMQQAADTADEAEERVEEAESTARDAADEATGEGEDDEESEA